MSELLIKIHRDLIEAQKKGEGVVVSTLRFLLASVKNREIELRPQNVALGDHDVIGIISRHIKQLSESIVEFEKGGRQDLVDKERAELEILKRYMPEALSQEELVRIVDEAIFKSGAKSPSDMGKVMALLMPQVKGRADGALVSNLVKERLK